MNKRKIGSVGEDLAAKYLEKQGVKILARNFYTRSGEIDIVGLDGEYTVFFEVKYRENDNCGDPSEAVTPRKIRKIVNTARFFLLKHGFGEDRYIRFDVVAITGERIEWIKNAFDAI